jgi:hypothetical protein
VINTNVRFDGPLWAGDAFERVVATSVSEFISRRPEKVPAAVRPPNNVTGLLRASWRSKQVGQFTIRIDNPTPYAIFQEEGTRYIEPRRMLASSHETLVVGLRRIIAQNIRMVG